MAQADHDRRVDYVEFGATDLERTRRFYERVFGWKFEDYGPDYSSFQDGRLSGGFTRDAPVPANPLVVIYAVRLEEVEQKIRSEGGKILRETYEYPGRQALPLRGPERERAGGVDGPVDGPSIAPAGSLVSSMAAALTVIRFLDCRDQRRPVSCTTRSS